MLFLDSMAISFWKECYWRATNTLIKLTILDQANQFRTNRSLINDTHIYFQNSQIGLFDYRTVLRLSSKEKRYNAFFCNLCLNFWVSTALKTLMRLCLAQKSWYGYVYLRIIGKILRLVDAEPSSQYSDTGIIRVVLVWYLYFRTDMK